MKDYLNQEIKAGDEIIATGIEMYEDPCGDDVYYSVFRKGRIMALEETVFADRTEEKIECRFYLKSGRVLNIAFKPEEVIKINLK